MASQEDGDIYQAYITGFCFGRVKPSDRVLSPSSTQPVLAAALGLGVDDGSNSNTAPRSLADIRDEAVRLVGR
jgi:hypothetical protein